MHAFKYARHRKANTLLLKCIRREDKKLGCGWRWGRGLKSDDQEEIEKLFDRLITCADFQGLQRGGCNNLGQHRSCRLRVLSCYRNGACLSGSAGRKRKGQRTISPLCLVEKPDCSLSSSWGGIHFHISSRSRFCRTPALAILEALSNKNNTKL